MADHSITTHTIQEETKEAILSGLTMYYLGASVSKAFAEVDGCSREHYQRLKNSHPEEIEVLDKEAKALALSKREESLTRIDTAQVEGSSKAQLAAIDAINEHLIQRLVDIVSLNGWVVDYRGAKVKVSVFPRDIAECGRLLRDIAKEGLISEAARVNRLIEKIPPGSTPTTNIAILHPGARTDWKELRVTQEDGTEVTVSIDEDIVDVEVTDSQ